MSTPSSPPDYKVGRGRPPEHSRFKKGRSGNPGGRRKRPASVQEVLETILHTEIEITIAGERRRVTVLEGMFWGQTQAGIRGNTRAAKWVLGNYADARKAISTDVLPEEDQAILARAKQRLAGLLPAPGDPDDPDTGEDDV